MGSATDLPPAPSAHTAGEAVPTPARQSPGWVPIRPLAERHRTRILRHLLSLDESDRYLRFGYQASDHQIERYVQRIDFARDEVFGIFNRRLELIAVAHLAHFEDGHARPLALAEFGVSVLPKARGRGFGAQLFDRAVLHARNRRVDRLVIHALTENRAMLRIARKAGASLQRDGSESEALLELPPDDVASHLGQLMEAQAAEVDYQMKLQARRMSAWLRMFTGADDGAVADASRH
jgi:RimJ/RimL family protein N-acetyltransferase